MRLATGFQSGFTTESPAKPGMRRPSATMSSARIIGFVVAEPLAAGAGFLLTKQAPEAGAAADLMGACRGPQPAGALEIAILACQRGQIVELQNHPRHVPGGGEEVNGFMPTRASTLQ